MTCKDGRFNTGNPICSNKPQDLHDNAMIIDAFTNSDADFVEDRFGVERKTIAGIEKEVNNTINGFDDLITQRINEKIIAQGGVEIINNWDQASDDNVFSSGFVKDRVVNEWGDSLERVISQKFLTDHRAFVTPFDFGGIGDGVSDDTQAIQDAVNSGKIVVIPESSGGWLVDSTIVDNVSGFNTCITLPEGARVIGGGGVIKVNADFINKKVAFSIRGSNVHATMIQIYGLNTLSTSWVVGFGVGTTYDSMTPLHVENVSISESRFNNVWLGVSSQYKKQDGNQYTLSNVSISRSSVELLDSATSGSAFNFRCEDFGVISDITVSDSFAKNGRTASSFNFVGVSNVNLSNLISENNYYAGFEFENGCSNVNAVNLISRDDYWGVWIDDSSRVNVNGLMYTSTKPIANSPYHPPSGVFRRAVAITRQGHDGFSSDLNVRDIFINNVISLNGGISITEYGDAVTDTVVENVSMNNFKLTSDFEDVNGLLVSSKNTSGININNVNIKGFANISIGLFERYVLQNICAENSKFTTSGIGNLDLTNVSVSSINFNHSRNDFYSSFTVNGVMMPNIDKNRVSSFYGMDTTEGAIARQGSILTTIDGKLFIKSNNVGDTGWVEK